MRQLLRPVSPIMNRSHCAGAYQFRHLSSFPFRYRYRFAADTLPAGNNRNNSQSIQPCFAGKIAVDTLKNILLASIQHLHDLVTEHKKAASAKADPVTLDTLKQMRSLQNEIEHLTNHKLVLYNLYKDNALIKDEYFAQRKTADTRIKELTSQVNLLEQKNHSGNDETITTNPVYEAMKDMPYPEQFTNELITALVNFVIVYNETRMEIKWKFSDSVISDLFSPFK